MSKKTDAWMPFYVGDYLAATSRLTAEQHGAYLLILIDYWINGAPPDDDEVLKAITRVPSKNWPKVKAAIRPFFNVLEGRWIQKRADKEKERAMEISGQRSEAGKLGAGKRWGKEGGNDMANAMAPPMANASQSESQNASQTGWQTSWQNDAPSQSQNSKEKPPQHAQSQEERAPDLGTPLRALPGFQNPDPEPPTPAPAPDAMRAGSLSKLLRDQGVLCTPSNPILLGWLELDITDQEARDAVETARRLKPKPEQIPIRYLDPIVREMREKPKVNGNHGGDRWWMNEASIAKKAQELGMTPRMGEGWPEFTDRIKQRIASEGRAA